MAWQQVLDAVKQNKCAALRFQQSGRHPFRDRITVYCDGRVLFERFCYGESAGLVFTLWANSVAPDGTLAWEYDACPNSHKTEAPRQVTGYTDGALLFDGKPCPWECTETLRSDAANGYSLASLFFKKFKQ